MLAPAALLRAPRFETSFHDGGVLPNLMMMRFFFFSSKFDCINYKNAVISSVIGASLSGIILSLIVLFFLLIVLFTVRVLLYYTRHYLIFNFKHIYLILSQLIARQYNGDFTMINLCEIKKHSHSMKTGFIMVNQASKKKGCHVNTRP